MFDVIKKELDWGGRKLTFETGRIARQADGAVLVTYGATVVLCTAVGQRQPKKGIDFFPLTVNYQEKTFAAGKIPGGFFKREGRPNEKETLTSRLIDRPIRPLFAKGYRNETQVICTVLSHDLENDPDVVSMVGASAALTISGLPFLGPIGGCRVGYKDGEYILNPTTEELAESDLELMLAGTKDGVLICFHDDMLDHILEAYGDVSDYSWIELQGFRFREPGPFGKHCRIPTLIEAFELHREYAGLMHLDIKRPGLIEPITNLLDRMDMWDHVVQAPADFSDPHIKRGRYKASLYLDRTEVDANEIAFALKRPGDPA